MLVRSCIAGLALLALLLVWIGPQTIWAYDPQTKYAKGFSEASFTSLSVGMKKDEMVHKLGKPLRQFSEFGITVYAYSDIGPYHNDRQKAFQQRWVAVGSDDRICYIFKNFAAADSDTASPVFEWVRGDDGVYHDAPGSTDCALALHASTS